MSDFFALLTILSIEAINCLQTLEMGYADKQANDILKLHDEGKGFFNLEDIE